MLNSILDTIKKMLGIEPDYVQFDTDITININSALLSINQIGIGPESGFFITSKTETWNDLFGDRHDLEAVKTLIYLKVKILFDPPSSSFVLDAMERQIKEFEFRLNIQAEEPPIIT